MSNLYLITGEETYEKNECLEKIKSSFGKLEKGINYIIIDKENISNLENEISTYPFGYDKKLIVVKEGKKSSKDDEESDTKSDFLTDSLINTLTSLDENVWVVFIGDYTLKSKLYKLVEKYRKMLCIFKKQRK